MSRPKLAIMGSGIISHFHIEAFKKAGFIISHCAASEGSQTAKDITKQYSIENYIKKPLDLIKAHNEWDILLLAIDTNSNHLYLDKILDLNKLCLVEKPVSTDLNFLREYLNEHTPKIRVAYNRRFYKTIARAKSFITEHDSVICRMELPENIDYKSKNKYAPVLLNSVHGIDLLLYLFGKLEIVKITNFPKNNGKYCELSNQNGDKIFLLMNWNSPSNFKIDLESESQRLEIKPFEHCKLYEGMEVIEPTKILPLRRYIPKSIEEISSFPSAEHKIKPGFFEQATEMKQILNGSKPKVSASLSEAYHTQYITQSIIHNNDI